MPESDTPENTPQPHQPSPESSAEGSPSPDLIPEPAENQGGDEYADQQDATKGEIVVYSLGGVIDEFTTSGFRNLNALLPIVFLVNPLLIGFINAIKTIWDGIMDPIVAHFSDNLKSRFGRRRPFILAGGICMALVAWITWQFMPENPNLQPNDPEVPDVYFSDSNWKKFGDLMLAYGVKDFNLKIEVDEEAAEQAGIPASLLKQFGEDAIKTIGGDTKALVRLESAVSGENSDSEEAQSESENENQDNDAATEGSENEGEEGSEETSSEFPTYTITLRPVSASEEVTPGPEKQAGLPFESTLEITLSGEDFSQEISSRITAEAVSSTVDMAEGRVIPFFEKVVYFFVGAPEEGSIQLQNEATEFTLNARKHRIEERAVMASIQLGLTDVLSRAYGLPYWQPARDKKTGEKIGYILPLDAPFSEEAKAEIRATAEKRLAVDSDFFEKLLISEGVKLNLSDPEITPEEKTAMENYMAEYEQASENVIFENLYGTLDVPTAASYHVVLRDPLKKREFKGIWEKIISGFDVFFDKEQDQIRSFLWFVLIMWLLMAMSQTLYSAAYYAQGIEIAPSYNGRTLVTAYRTVANTLINFLTQIFLPLSLLPLFMDARMGSLFLVYILSPIGIILAFAVFFGTKERTVIIRDQSKKPKFFRAIKEIGKNPEFWRICGMYLFMGYALGSFQGLGLYITVYYVFDGNALLGTSYGSIAGTIGMIMGLLAIPLYVYLCKRIDKHNTLRLALGFLALGSAIKYWCYNPDMPELLFIVPLFYSPAIAMFYNVLSSMMGDVTDLDELRNGERREGMFGAVMAIIMKSLGAFSAIASGLIVVASGFEIEKGVHQDPGVFQTMLILFSIVPGITSIAGFLILANFKLTQKRVSEIKQQLAVQRAERARLNKELEAGSNDGDGPRPGSNT